MDLSASKVTAETGPKQHQQHSDENQTDVPSSPPYGILNYKVGSARQEGGAYPCPACPLMLTSSHDLTNHLRCLHSSPPRSASSSATTDSSDHLDSYSCGVCHKVLSSANSLDRHVLVHSGERPFKCKYCDMAFTTNGNMNRHLRNAHLPLGRANMSPYCTDSEGSSDSERPMNHRHQHHLGEYNNNEVAKRKSPELLLEHVKRPRLSPDKTKDEGFSESGSLPTSYSCTVCGKQEFASSAHLEAHLESSHPEIFKNHRALNIHRLMMRGKNSVVGFNDLTFVDFSSGKFPAIARAVCEQSLHRPASGETPKYQCSKCLRAFPCQSALDGHEVDCGHPPNHRLMRDDQSLRDDFFANLDLQNKAALAEAKEGKDLADIQSIISVTSGPILHNFSRSDASTPDNCKVKQNHHGSSASSGTPSSEHHEEEAQDAFAAEFRKMKMKGEFPCRLCKAIFPNLRALKGHNRAHLGSVGPGMPIPCNMCPYSSTDKNTLQRHLRSHNGDRPYECSICNYAFTTKANCERHVRNRHGKLSREEIKNALIYHPSEDSTNDASLERNSPRSGAGLVRDEVRKTLVYSEREEQPSSQPQQPLHYPAEIRIKDESKLRQPGLPGLMSVVNDAFPRPEPLELSYRGEELDAKLESIKHDEDNESRSSEGSMSLVSETKVVENQRIQGSPMDLKKSSVATDSSPEEVGSNVDAPLDLSMDVLDLSKRSAAAAAAAASSSSDAATATTTEEKDKESNDASVEALAKNHKDFYNTANQLLLTQALIKAGHVGVPPPSFESLYANPHMMYPNFSAFPGAGMIPPYLFAPFGQDFGIKDRLQKELVRGLQTSGGRLVDADYSPTPEYSTTAAFPQTRNPISDYQKDFGDLRSPKISKKSAPTREKDGESSSSNSVKMVYKNGCFMPKQKQRRYRTERPFKCQYCSAGFTLRSNMERHIKQQHPQHWKQRIRGAHSTRGRPPANPPTLVQNLRPSQISPSYSSHLSKLDQPLSSDYGKHAISDQVKYAILAQQLKGTKTEDNESDEELIIDEAANLAKESKESKEPTERTLSLLRDKLEANIESRGSENFHPPDIHSLCEVKMEVEEKSEADSKEDVHLKEDESKAHVKSEIQSDERMEYTENQDLASVSEILDNASQHYQHFQSQYISDEEGLVASTSDCNQSGSDEKSDSMNSGNSEHSSHNRKKKMIKKKKKKKSAYSMAPNRVICPYCQRPFPWHSSLRRHVLTHTGQKPFRCTHCSLLFTTKSNCDRHLLRKHKKELGLKIRRTRSTSSPEMQEAPETSRTLAPSPTNNNSQFSMRNVPERPYKCNQCPSSTFSTLGNLKKHRSTKHGVYMRSRPESPSSEPRNSPSEYSQEHPECSPEHSEERQRQDQQHQNHEQGHESNEEKPHESPEDYCSKQNDQSGYESQSSGVSDNMENFGSEPNDLSKNMSSANNTSSSANEASRSRKNSPRSSPGPTNNNNPETPFKCHLCDSGFSERNDCLDHIKDNHEQSYEMLVAKGQARGLDMDDGFDDPMPPYPPQSQNPGDGEVKRGRFPDYSNRKVMCAFCMRRFWSAEDLRRHMRTHTGERPFFCDICFRKFTLKHSMLRHRKKHESVDSSMYVGTSGDEDCGVSITAPSLVSSSHQPPTITPRSQQPSSSASSASSVGSGVARLQERASLPQVASVATGDAAPSSFMRFNPYDKLSALSGKLSMSPANMSIDANDNEENDLISDLLGFRDKSIIDRALQAPSVDVAAKIIGVKGNHEYETRSDKSM